MFSAVHRKKALRKTKLFTCTCERCQGKDCCAQWRVFVFFGSSNLHPGRLTWNIIVEVWKIIFLSKWVICRFHVNLPGCIPPQTKKNQHDNGKTTIYHLKMPFLLKNWDFPMLTSIFRGKHITVKDFSA